MAWYRGKTHNPNMKIKFQVGITELKITKCIAFSFLYILHILLLLRAETKKNSLHDVPGLKETWVSYESALPEHPHPGKLKATQPEGNYRWLAWGEVQLGKASDTSLVQITRRDI